jgi:hypothetical protein
LRDRRIVSRGAGESLGGETAARRLAHGALMLVELFQHNRIVCGIDNDGEAAMILGRGADHRRAANINILDRHVPSSAFRGHLLERIEIDDEELEGCYRLGFERLDMLGIAAIGQKPAMNLGVERLDPAVHDLGETGDGRDIRHGETSSFQRLGGAAGRDKPDAARCQRAGKIDEARLVGNGQQSAA